VSDVIVRAQADDLVSTGMKAAGYVYVNIDGCWQGERDVQGNIQPNQKFPDMRALGDYIHSKGLKFDIYIFARANDLRRFCGKFRTRGAGCPDLRRLGGQILEVRLLHL
jgi:alpha-galactosidase